MCRPTSYRLCILCAILATVLALLLLAPPSVTAAPATQRPASFIMDVAPIFKENCFACHDAKKRKGTFDMTTYAHLRKGGENEDPIVSGSPDESLLCQVLVPGASKRMPPKESGDMLPKDKVEIVRRWVAEGAKLDPGIDPKADLLRELRIRWKPPAPPAAYKYAVTINALAFTSDGKQLVVGGYHEMTVWDIAQGKLVKRITTRAERAKAMVFLADGKLVVAGGRPGQEGDVKIYDLQAKPSKTEQGVAFLDGVNDKAVMLKELMETDDEVLCLALSGDGKKLAAGGCDRIVKVWDLSGGATAAKLEQTIENHADWVFGVAFSPDNVHLLTCGRDKTAKVWDLAKKESVLTFPDHQNPVYAVAVSPDGKVGISVGEDNQLRFWNAATDGKQVRAIGGHGKVVFKVVRNPKQPQLLTCSADATVRVWNADSGAAIKTLTGPNDWVYAVAVSPDGNQAAAGSWNGEVTVWSIADGMVVKSFNGSPGLAPQTATAPAPNPQPAPAPVKKK